MRLRIALHATSVGLLSLIGGFVLFLIPACSREGREQNSPDLRLRGMLRFVKENESVLDRYAENVRQGKIPKIPGMVTFQPPITRCSAGLGFQSVRPKLRPRHAVSAKPTCGRLPANPAKPSSSPSSHACATNYGNSSTDHHESSASMDCAVVLNNSLVPAAGPTAASV